MKTHNSKEPIKKKFLKGIITFNAYLKKNIYI